jgi:predicted ATPase
MVLNEPETSLHPDLLPALARLIARAARSTQMVVVTHADKLIDALKQEPDCNAIHLEKKFGETLIIGANHMKAPGWHWPSR